jgi:acyl carrier protein
MADEAHPQGEIMATTLEQLQPIFEDVLDQPDLVITRDSNAQNVEDWDSLAHVNIVTAVERKFKIKFALGELQDLKNVGDMVDLIDKKLAAK